MAISNHGHVLIITVLSAITVIAVPLCFAIEPVQSKITVISKQTAKVKMTSRIKTKADEFSDAGVNPARAKFNYQMLCQGCHTPDGSGKKAVPEIKNFIGNFLSTQAGREYLIKVPGSANSALDDKALTEVINWIIIEMAGTSKPQTWQYYRADEVARYRQAPLLEVVEYRKQLLKNINK